MKKRIFVGPQNVNKNQNNDKQYSSIQLYDLPTVFVGISQNSTMAFSYFLVFWSLPNNQHFKAKVVQKSGVRLIWSCEFLVEDAYFPQEEVLLARVALL